MALSILLIALLASAEVEGRGSTGELPRDAFSLRKDARLRASVGGAATFGLSNHLPTGGFSFVGELGTTLMDLVALTAHLELGTAIVSVIGSFGLGSGLALGEHFSLGLGVSLSGWRPTGSWPGGFYGLTFPMRISFAPGTRAPTELARKGLLFALQIAPGVSLQPPEFYQGSPRDPAALTVTMSAAYAVW